MKESDILYEVGDYWVCRSKSGTGYEVYRNEITHSVRCAIIGWPAEKGLERAITEANKRANGETRFLTTYEGEFT